MNYLKIFRVTVAVIFLGFFTFVFVDFNNSISYPIIAFFTGLQFVPSILQFLAVFSLTASGFILIIFLTIFFGRIYCSALCPLGILQDVLIRIKKWILRKEKFHYSKPFTKTRYLLLFLTVIPVFFGNIFILSLLDPYSIFGRIGTNLFRPLVYMINNTADHFVQSLGSYSLYHLEYHTFSWLSLTISAVFLIFITFLTLFRSRLFCNLICPVGTLLGLISKISLFKFKINNQLCTNCSACARTCKSECIDPKERTIDMSRCVVCFNCLKSCPQGGLVYQAFQTKSNLLVRNADIKDMSSIDQSKRDFIASIWVSLSVYKVFPFQGYGLGHNNGKGHRKQGYKAIPPQLPVCPPGSKSIERFTSLCTACHLCITHCPSQVLKPSSFEYGWAGMMQPRLDYNTSFCNYECIICSQVCPTGAILPLTKEEKKTIQLGKVRFIHRNCIVRTHETECGACSEHCPTKAVYLVPYKTSLYIPEVNPDICVGCGACEYICPAVPVKAIYVETNTVHRAARLPEKMKQDSVPNSGDFPF